MRHGASPLHTLMLKGPARPGEEASWEPQPPRQMGRKSVYRVTMPAQARASLLMLVLLSLPGRGQGGGAVTVPGLHSWLVTEASLLLAPLPRRDPASILAATPPATSQSPPWVLNKAWQSALPRESLPGPSQPLLHFTVCVGAGGSGRAYGAALPSSVRGSGLEDLRSLPSDSHPSWHPFLLHN